MKNIKMKVKLEYIFYGMAAFMTLFALLNFYNMHQYISTLSAAGQLNISQQLTKVIIAYLEAVIPYIFYAASLFGFGFIIAHMKLLIEKHQTFPKVQETAVRNGGEEDDDDAIDEYLHTIAS